MVDSCQEFRKVLSLARNYNDAARRAYFQLMVI